MSKILYVTSSDKNTEEAVKSIKESARDFGFIVRDVFDMGEEFRKHGVNIENGFDFYSLMLCNPEKAYQSIVKNPVRGAVLLPPKQIVVYRNKKTGKTNIAYLAFNRQFVKKLLPDDKPFQESLPDSCRKIIKLIKNAK